MIKFNLQVNKASRSGGNKNLISRDKSEFIIRLRSSYKSGSVESLNYKKLMDVAKFKGIENRSCGENGVLYVGDRVKIFEDLNNQIATASGDELENLKKQKEFLNQFVDGNYWNITAKDMALSENLDMLLDLNENSCL